MRLFVKCLETKYFFSDKLSKLRLQLAKIVFSQNCRYYTECYYSKMLVTRKGSFLYVCSTFRFETGKLKKLRLKVCIIFLLRGYRTQKFWERLKKLLWFPPFLLLVTEKFPFSRSERIIEKSFCFDISHYSSLVSFCSHFVLLTGIK